MLSAVPGMDPSQGISGKTGSWIVTTVFAAVSILDFFCLIFSYGLPHNVILLLAYQYVILLPATIWYLRAKSEVATPDLSKLGSRASTALVAALAFIGSAIMSYQRAPGVLVADEQVYHFQAQLLQHGMLRAPAPPEIANESETPVELRFNHNLITTRGWTGMYPLGWPLILAIGERFHAPWLVTPALGAVLVLLTSLLGRIAFDRNTGFVAAVLLFPAPFFFVSTSGMMSHAMAACLVTAALCLIEAGVKCGSASRTAAGLAVIALCYFVRPFTCVAAGAALGIVLAWRLRGDPLLRKLVLPALGVSALAAAAYFLQNKAATGNYVVSAYALSAGAQYAPELTINIPVIIRRCLPETVTSIELTVFYSAPFLFLLAAWALAVMWRTAKRGACVLLGAVLVGSVLLFLANGSNFQLPGQRMYFEGMPGVAVLAASAVLTLAARWRLPVKTFALAAAFVALIQTAQFIRADREITTRLGPWANFHRHIEALPLANAVVFMKPVKEPGQEFTPSNFNPNQIDWPRAPKVYLLDPGPERRNQVARAFDRSRWAVVDYTPSNDSFTVETAGEVAAP